MSKSKIQTQGICKIGVGLAQNGVRNPFALAALARKGGSMKDKRTPRGGARNHQREILAEV
jgi:hypothetical protein